MLYVKTDLNKQIVRAKIFCALVAFLASGCTQVNTVMGTQDSAPIESRSVNGAQQEASSNDGLTTSQAETATNGMENDVIKVVPLESNGVGAPIPITDGTAGNPAPVSDASSSVSRSNSSNDATRKLLADARQSFVAGDLTNAEAITNRGLRIAPQDPTLWLQLAKIRLGQKSYAESISLSERAQVLGEDNAAIQVDALQVIARAQRALGRSDLADQAEKRALQVRGNLGLN